MPHRKSFPAQGAADNASQGDKSKPAPAAGSEIPVGRSVSQTALEGTPESRRKEADRQAIERGEDDGMR